MPPTLVNTNTLGSLAYTESAGLADTVTVVARVRGYDATTLTTAIEDVLNNSVPAVPSVGAELTINGDVIVLLDRSVTFTEDQHALVTLTYKRISVPGGGGGTAEFDVRGGGSMEARERETDFQSEPKPLLTGWDGEQEGGTISYGHPVHTTSVASVEETNFPMSLAVSWNGYVNDALWGGGLARTWLVRSVSYEPVNKTGTIQKWRFTWEFAYDRTGHDPFVLYIDPITGQVPDGIDLDNDIGAPQGYGSGYAVDPLPPVRRVHAYPERDFSAKFGF